MRESDFDHEDDSSDIDGLAYDDSLQNIAKNKVLSQKLFRKVRKNELITALRKMELSSNSYTKDLTDKRLLHLFKLLHVDKGNTISKPTSLFYDHNQSSLD